MANKDIEKSVLEQSSLALNRPLTEEETHQILLWHRGKSLREITMLPGWSILTDIVKDQYIADAVKDYEKTIDKDPAKVTVQDLKDAHAVAFAVKRAFTIFLEDIEAAAEFSINPPEIVRLAAKMVARNEKLSA